MNDEWSPAAAQLIETRPSAWEYRLLSQCLAESIERQLSVPCHEPSTSELSGSKFTFHVASLEAGQQFVKCIIKELEDFTERLTAAIRISPDDASACFGSPGQPGDPQLIAELAQRLALNLAECRQKAAEIQCLRVVCEEAPLQVVADLFLRSFQDYTSHEYELFEAFLRELGLRLIERLDAGNEKINLVFKMSSFRPAHQPLIYQLGRVPKQTSKSPTFGTITKAAIQVTFIDTETTGLGEGDEPISIGAVKYEVATENGILSRVIDTYYELREPTVPVGDQAFQIHAISNDQLRGKRWDMDRVQSLLDADLVVAHNADFDMRMLSKLMTIDAKRWTCSMKNIMDIWGRRNWVSLDNLASRCGLDRPLPHNAFADAKTLTHVLAQPLPTSTVKKTVLWELIRRHFGFQPMTVEDNVYLVWGHYTPDGTLVYVWTARRGEPNGPDDDFYLSYYIRKQLPKGCVVVPVKGDLTFDEALEVKDELLKEHHATLLNRVNLHRPLNAPTSASQETFYAELDQARSLEKVDAEAAIRCHTAAMHSVMERGYLQVESGLIGQLQVEINQDSRQLENMLLKPLDRISLLLCRQGTPDRAIAVLDEVKAKFPALIELAGALPIIKRIDKALGRLPSPR